MRLLSWLPDTRNMKSGLWRIVFWGILELAQSQQTTNENASGVDVAPTPVLHNHSELSSTSLLDLSPSFTESKPTRTMETPNQQELLTLTLINATNYLEEYLSARPDAQNSYSLTTQDEEMTLLPNDNSVNHFVLLATDSSENDTDDEQTISPTPVTNVQLSTSLAGDYATPFVQSRSMSSVAPSPTQTELLVSSIYNETMDSEEAFMETEFLNKTKIGFQMKFQSDCIKGDSNQSSPLNFLDEFLRHNTTLAGQNFSIMIRSNVCERIISEIPVLLEETGPNVQDILTSLKALVGKTNITVNFSGKSYVLTLVSVVPFPSNTSRDVESQKNKDMDEYLPYVIIGGVFGGIILIVLILICGKCLCRCRKQKTPKKPDFEVPHLSLRPEDYILTRIPRPTTIYQDNMASPIMHDDVSLSSGHACYNGDQPQRQPFETSVVPLDDDPYYRYKQHEYLPPNESSTELRTFNGKRLHHRSTETEDGVLYRNPYMSASNEKIHELNHRRSRDGIGIDNQGYMRA